MTPDAIEQLKKEHALALAYIDGVVEAAHGGWADKNPYPQNLPQHAEWRRGWETRHRPDKRAELAQKEQSISAKKVNELTAALHLSQDAVHDLTLDMSRLAAALRALVDSLPDCRICDRPATRAFPNDPMFRYCDAHGIQPQDALIAGDAPDLPYATALRVALGEIE